MSTQHIVTGHYVRIAATRATVTQRILAAVLDYFVIIAWMLVATFLPSLLGLHTGVIRVVSFYLLTIPAMLYQPLCEYITGGQTLGKRVMHTRVAMADGSSPSIAAYLLRWMLLPVDVIFFGAVALFTMLITPRRQRLGDLAAGTMVIRLGSYAQQRVSLEEFRFVDEGYEPTYPDAARLSPADADRIARTLTDHSSSRRHRIQQLARQLTEAYSLPHSTAAPEPFLSQLLSDYRYYELHAI